ncbi:hypothetical protein MPER_14512, partial [Moniliophthora perniciosa FA553]
TEDTGYFWTADHNYTTPWSFDRDVPAPTHVFIHIGRCIRPADCDSGALSGAGQVQMARYITTMTGRTTSES